MKILITTDWYANGTNGVVTSVKNLSRALRERGHEVRILTLSERPHSYKDGAVYCIRSVPIHVYPQARLALAYRHRLVKELIRWKPDVIHSQCEFCSMQWALHIAKHTGAPIVHTYHTLYEQYVRYIGLGEGSGKTVVRGLTNLRLRQISLVIAPTAKTREVLLGYDPNMPIRVIPSGIDLARFGARLSDAEKRDRRRALGIPAGSRVLVYLGRLGAEKRVDELLTFFVRVRETHPDTVLLVVGDGPARAELEKERDRLGLSASVIFTGLVDPSTVQDYYQLGDVFVCASTSEAQGLTYVEAAASGLPLLCRADPCLDPLIRSGENGYAYTTEEEFMEAIDRILSDASWRAVARKTSETLAEAFSIETFGASAEEAYLSVLEKSNYDAKTTKPNETIKK